MGVKYDGVEIAPYTADEALRAGATAGTNVRVARDVMGFQWDEERGCWHHPKGKNQLFVPTYSVDMGIAWQVVEAMSYEASSKGFLAHWEGPILKQQDWGWPSYPIGTTCWYVGIITESGFMIITADTPALAVCRASLWVTAMSNDISLPNLADEKPS
jgi:hypothetical protein